VAASGLSDKECYWLRRLEELRKLLEEINMSVDNTKKNYPRFFWGQSFSFRRNQKCDNCSFCLAGRLVCRYSGADGGISDFWLSARMTPEEL